MVVHVPVLLAHSFGFFLLCRIYTELFESNGALVSGFPEKFVIYYCSLLALNAIWLVVLQLPQTPSKIIKEPEALWIANNTIFVIVISVGFFLLGFGFMFAITCFFLNSVIDLLFNGKAYLTASPG